MKVVVQLITAAILLVVKKTFVSTSPISNQDVPSELDVLPPNSGLSNKDQDVKDLERLKPLGSLAVVKTHSTIYTNINGKEKQLAQTREEVDKDGRMVARIEQKIDNTGESGAPQIKTSLDIPSRNIHKTIVNAPNNAAGKIDLQARGPAGLQYSPSDMAEYVYWTGDEVGVTSAIEEYLQAGMMSKEDAIDFLQEIKRNLELMQSQFLEYAGEQPVKGSQDERAFYSKKSMQDSFGTAGGLSNLGSGPIANKLPAEEEYEDLIDKLKMSDYLYNEYSLEEVIYQLAKVMFTQSLSRGSIEAQDTLQKVTGFLDFEAQQGKITRNMEKKILSVLISALSDTLTEHPELVNTARESLGIPQPEPLVHRLLLQGAMKPGDESADGIKNHRFQGASGHNMKRTIQNSGLKDEDKKTS